MGRMVVAVCMLAGLLVPGTAEAAQPCTIPEGRPVPGSGAVLRVPEDHPTIQAAVDAAAEGDTVLVAPGVYEESVVVQTPGLRIRGASRASTILDGGGILPFGIFVAADRVLIENMTARSHASSGFYWDRATGFWGRYLTTYGTLSTGLYASESRCGQFDHSYASGAGFVGFYVGVCFPCDTVVTDVVGVESANGFAECNAGGNLVVRDSLFTRNAIGIAMCSWDGRPRPPQRGGAIVRDNLVVDNNGLDVPGNSPPITDQCCGGIVIAGGNGNTIVGNIVSGHRDFGIFSFPVAPYTPAGNVVVGNQVAGPPGSFDLAQDVAAGPDNCWSDNLHATAAPAVLETVWGCGLPATPPGGDPRVSAWFASVVARTNGRIADPDAWKTWPAPAEPEAFVEMPPDDGAVDGWLPALGLTG